MGDSRSRFQGSERGSLERAASSDPSLRAKIAAGRARANEDLKHMNSWAVQGFSSQLFAETDA